MELLYVWINKSENGVFQNKDINLSPDYSFVCDGYILEEKPLNDKAIIRPNIFNEYANNIINVTAIVGKNGMGKTTLFKYLLDHAMPHPLQNETRAEYKRHFDIEDEKKKTIFVVKEYNVIYAYHNLEMIEVNSTSISQTIRVERGDGFLSLLSNNAAYNNTTIAYLSNSQYLSVSGGFSSGKTHPLFFLTYPERMQYIWGTPEKKMAILTRRLLRQIYTNCLKMDFTLTVPLVHLQPKLLMILFIKRPITT